MKLFAFRALMLTPLVAMIGVPVFFCFFTNVPQLLYLQSIRNISFDCMRFVDADYVYAMTPGPCRLANLEYDEIFTHDADGFRNLASEPDPEVAVIGDSHAYGYGVGDAQTFSALLTSAHRYRVRNFGIPSYATARELETLASRAPNARYVVLQYCDNDVGESEASLIMGKEGMRALIETELKNLMASYREGKAQGWRKPLSDLVRMIRDGTFASRTAWRRSADTRDMEKEASLFARVLERYRPLLEGKRLIVFESAGFGLNAPQFAAAFERALHDLRWLNARILDSTRLVGDGDYYFFDDHLRPAGHAKIAAAIGKVIGEWEKAKPVLDSR